MNSKPSIAVVGGGISGLACANRLQKLLPEAEILLLEAQSRLGGLLETVEKDGFVLEGAPDCFLADKPFIGSWLKENGLNDLIIGTEPLQRRSYVLINGKATALPKGFYLLSPTSFKALFGTSMLSWAGKLRAACEFFIPPKTDGKDESAADFVRRRFGKELLEKIGQPMVGGIYTADPSRLSMQAAMPRFYEMEQKHGSILRALMSRKKRAEQEASGPRYSLFLSMKKGMEQLAAGLASRLDRVKIHTGFRVKNLERGTRWTLTAEDGRSLKADVVCLALPAFRSAELLRPLEPETAQALEKIPYESVATLNLAYRAADVSGLPEGFGIVIPAAEKRNLVGISFSSQKFSGRAPQDGVLIRVFIGGSFHRALLEKSDAELQKMAQEELHQLLNIQAKPLLAVLKRYPLAMPQYPVGHLENVEKIFSSVKALPGLFLTGNAYWGVGIPECIFRAEQAADRIAEFCGNRAEKSAGFDHILLVGFGGPEKPEDVWPFLLEVTRGTRIPEERLKTVQHHYEQAGGVSPYNGHVAGLKEKLERALAGKHAPLPVFTGMKNWHPFMKDTLADIRSKGLKKGLAVVLAPHRSDASWDKYLRCVEEAKREAAAQDLEYEFLGPWFDRDGFISALAAEAGKIMEQLPADERKYLHVIFCAHSIPEDMARECRYAEEFKTSSQLTAAKLGVSSWSLAYQSRSGNPRQPWLGPDVSSVFGALAEKGFKSVLVVPAGFLCENVEILYDLDIEAKQAAEKTGLHYYRSNAVMDRPEFISMLTDMIREKAGKTG